MLCGPINKKAMEENKNELQEEARDNGLNLKFLGKRIDDFKRETFCITLYEWGAVYHVYNSMYLVARRNMQSLYGLLEDYVLNKDIYNSLEGEEKERFELTLSAVTYVLSSPMYAFSDADLMFCMASLIVKHIKKTFDDNIDKPLQDEDIEKDIDYERAEMAVSEIRRLAESVKIKEEVTNDRIEVKTESDGSDEEAS